MDDAVLDYGDLSSQVVSRRSAVMSSLATLKALGRTQLADGLYAFCVADGSRWRFSRASVLAADDLLVAAPSDGSTGRWLRAEGDQQIVIPFDFNKADAAILLTVPAGCILAIDEAHWRVNSGVGDVSFTGGAASAIGLSSSNEAGFTAKGALLGGAGGDVAATLVAAALLGVAGTIGSAMDTHTKRHVLWLPTATVRFDRITSAFAAGSGAAVLHVNVLQNLGA